MYFLFPAVSKFYRENLKNLGSKASSPPVISRKNIGSFPNYMKSTQENEGNQQRLSLSVHAVTAIPEGLTPTILVFGAVPPHSLPPENFASKL